MFDTEKAATRCQRMWRKLGGLLEAKAYERASNGFDDRAVAMARLADVCFWQATGEIDSPSWSDVMPPKAEG